MADNPYLQMLSATPAEQEALQRIARLRGLGFSDGEIFGGIGSDTGLGSSTMRLANTDLLKYGIEQQGIQSSYNLGRGNLAQQAIQDQYTRQTNPFNIVTALQEYADTGQSDLLSSPVLKNIAPGPAAKYQGFLDSLFSAPVGAGAAGEGTSAAPAAAGGDPWAPMRGYTPEQNAQFIRDFGGAAPAAAAPVLGSGAAAAGGGQTAQQAGARLLGSAMTTGLSGGAPGALRATLGSGDVPGFGQLTESDWNRLGIDRSGALLGLVQSTGRTSDAAAALRDYQRRNSMGGLALGSVGY